MTRSKLGEAEAIYEGVYLLSLFTEGAFVSRMGEIIAEVLGIEYGADVITCALVESCKYRADACYGTVIILDRLDSRLSGISRGDRCGENENVLALDHRNDIVTEDKLASRGVLGGDHIDGLMRVEIHKIAVSQLLGEAGSYYLSAVEAEDGVDDGGVIIIRHKLLSYRLSLGKTGLLGSHVDIIVYMAVAGCKVTLGDAKVEVLVLGSDLCGIDGWHYSSVPRSKRPFF